MAIYEASSTITDRLNSSQLLPEASQEFKMWEGIFITIV